MISFRSGSSAAARGRSAHSGCNAAAGIGRRPVGGDDVREQRQRQLVDVDDRTDRDRSTTRSAIASTYSRGQPPAEPERAPDGRHRAVRRRRPARVTRSAPARGCGQAATPSINTRSAIATARASDLGGDRFALDVGALEHAQESRMPRAGCRRTAPGRRRAAASAAPATAGHPIVTTVASSGSAAATTREVGSAAISSAICHASRLGSIRDEQPRAQPPQRRRSRG